MPRVIKRQITTIKIVSVELTWSDEADPIDVEPIDRTRPALSQPPRLHSKKKTRRKTADQPAMPPLDTPSKIKRFFIYR